MKTQIAMTALRAAVKELKHHIGNVKKVPILGQIRVAAGLDTVTLEATNYDVSYAIDLPATLLGQPGAKAVLIPHSTLEKVCKVKGAAVVDIEANEAGNVILKADDLAINVKALSTDDYPLLFQLLSESYAATFDAWTFGAAIQAVEHAASRDVSRRSLNAIYLQAGAIPETFRVVATDTHRLAMQEILATSVSGKYNGNDGGILLPLAAAAAIRRHAANGGTIKLTEAADGHGTLTISGTNWRLQTRPVEGRFPTYEMVIPRQEDCAHGFHCKAKELQQAVATVSQFAEKGERFKGVKLEVKNDKLAVSYQNASAADITKVVDIANSNLTGEPLVVGFNADYLVDALASFLARCSDKETCDVTVRIVDEVSPTILTGDMSGACVVMPMRI